MFEAVLRTDEKDRKVNYSLAGATLPLSVYNTFFIYSVEISGYRHLWRDSQRKTIADSLTQFPHPIPNHAFLSKINFRDYLINQKQAIAVDVNPDGHNEIPLSVRQRFAPGFSSFSSLVLRTAASHSQIAGSDSLPTRYYG